MFSLKTTALKVSVIGIAYWCFFTGCCALLLRLFWLPEAMWWLLCGVLIVLLSGLLYRRVTSGVIAIGIDDNGAYQQQGKAILRLEFVRFNGLQLIAKRVGKRSWYSRLWPRYLVIYRDSLPYYEYRVLRSFAAQQKILKRSEVESKKS